MSHVKVMMVKHDKREIEQLKHVFEEIGRASCRERV